MNLISTTLRLSKSIFNSKKLAFGLCCRVELYVNRSIHVYRDTVPWNNAVDFSEYLVKTCTYNDNGLLVLNKPYGVTFSRSGNASQILEESKQTSEEKVFRKQHKKQAKDYKKYQYCTSGIVSESLSLVDCLPYIKQYFGFKKLYISRVPGKYVSGVAILTHDPELVTKINDIHTHPPTGKDTYLAIVVGVPRHSEGVIKLGFKLEEHPEIGKKAVLLEKWSNKAYKRGEIRIGTFHYRTLCSGFKDLTSLVEVRVDLRKYNALRVFASDYLLAPVLGDNLLGCRVQTVLGVPTSVHPFSDAALRPQKLPEEICSMLDLTSGESGIIPIHVHMSEMLLPRFLNGKDLSIKASPPPHFLWACKKLGLSLSQQVQAIAAV